MHIFTNVSFSNVFISVIHEIYDVTFYLSIFVVLLLYYCGSRLSVLLQFPAIGMLLYGAVGLRGTCWEVQFLKNTKVTTLQVLLSPAKEPHVIENQWN